MRYKYLIILSIVALTAFLYSPTPGFATTILGSAQDFAVLGSSTVTNTGSTTVYGDLGLYSGTSITGFFGTAANDGPGLVTGGIVHQTDGAAQQAQSDAIIAYNTLAGLLPGITLSGTLAAQTLFAGVYNFTGGAALLTDALTLDAQGNPNARFVFQMASTLKLGPGSSVNVTNGGPGNEVYWVVGSSATLDTGTHFVGNILADQSITMNTAADVLCGRAIALNGAVTMDTNRVSNNNTAQAFGSNHPDFGSYGFSGGSAAPVPEPSTMFLFGLGGVATAFMRRSRKA